MFRLSLMSRETHDMAMTSPVICHGLVNESILLLYEFNSILLLLSWQCDSTLTGVVWSCILIMVTRVNNVWVPLNFVEYWYLLFTDVGASWPSVGQGTCHFSMSASSVSATDWHHVDELTVTDSDVIASCWPSSRQLEYSVIESGHINVVGRCLWHEGEGPPCQRLRRRA